ncbi:hypothetical protein HFN89_01105 [Rhizobium laguerreae]|nr:hypothetical protein [Rhizobium laguerreae]
MHETISLAGHKTPDMRLYKYMEDHIWNSGMFHGWMRRGDRRDDRIWVGRDDEPARDRPPFHEWLVDIDSYDQDELDELVRHYNAIADRLLVIGNDVWIEIRSPCIAVVTLAERQLNDFLPEIEKTFIYHGVLPDMVSNDVTRRWFSLDQGEEALDYARRFSSSGSEVVDLRLPIECEQSDFAFDVDGERLWHVAYALALHCKDSAKHVPRKFDDDERVTIDEAYLQATKTNCVLRHRGTPENSILKLLPLSERINYRRSLMTLGIPSEPWKRARLHNEVLDLLDNGEIDIYRLG